MSTAFWTYCSNFNDDLSSWNVASVTDMSFTFAVAKDFNRDISSWNVAKVKNAEYMFANTQQVSDYQFNQDIGNWNTAAMTSMLGMFWYHTSFPKSYLSRWDTSRTSDLTSIGFWIPCPSGHSTGTTVVVYGTWEQRCPLTCSEATPNCDQCYSTSSSITCYNCLSGYGMDAYDGVIKCVECTEASAQSLNTNQWTYTLLNEPDAFEVGDCQFLRTWNPSYFPAVPGQSGAASSVGAIVGGVVGGLAFIAVIVVVVVVVVIVKRNRAAKLKGGVVGASMTTVVTGQAAAVQMVPMASAQQPQQPQQPSVVPQQMAPVATAPTPAP